MNRAEKRRQHKLNQKAARRTPNQNSIASLQSLELAVQHQSAGRLSEAESLYKQILQADPNQPIALHLLGLIAHQMGKNDIAVELINKAITSKPGHAEPHSNLGNALQELGKLDEAVENYKKAIAIKPDYHEAHSSLGNTFQGLGKTDEAIASYNKAIAIKSDFAEAHYNLGNALQGLGKTGEAVESLRALKDLRKIDKALKSYNKAIAIKPDFAEAHSNLGIILQGLGKIDEAVESFNKALTTKPHYAEAHSNLGNALQGIGELDGAVASYKQAVAIKPENTTYHSNLLQTEQYRLGQNQKKLYKLHKDWDERHAQRFKAIWPKHLNTPNPDRILRIGFVSPDLGRHPVGYFLVRFLENINETEIKTIIYSDRIADDLTYRIKAASSLWRDVKGISDDLLSKIIVGDEIDILFDLTGHSAKNRLLLFARKPAPIQVSWAGYVGTTGLSSIDYLLSDIHSTPVGEEKYYSEKIILMPDGWLCYDPPNYAPVVGSSPYKKNGNMTFCSFSNPVKINEEVISVWARIMNKVENSHLLIKYKGINSTSNIERLTTKFAFKGVDKSRLVLEGASPHVDLLARYNDVDIALDTFPYSGGLTTFEALWMGVPVITVPGQTFASRHSLSHLSAIGLPELVAKDKDDYVRLAVELAGSTERIAKLRAGLRSRMTNSPICDGEKFARNFTTAMQRIWCEWCLAQDRR